MSSLRRVAPLAVLSIPITIEMAWGEILFAGHIILLVDSLGFGWGLVAFSAIWAVGGLAILAAADFLWPKRSPLLSPSLSRLAGGAGELLRRTHAMTWVGVLVVAGLLAGAAAASTLMGREVGEWTVDHRVDVAILLVAAVVVLAILVALSQLGRRLVNWARSTAETAGPIKRSLGALMSMAVLGPALVWPVLRLLRYSRGSVYALTFLAGPIFGAVWVPVYGLGVWGLVQGLI